MNPEKEELIKSLLNEHGIYNYSFIEKAINNTYPELDKLCYFINSYVKYTPENKKWYFYGRLREIYFSDNKIMGKFDNIIQNNNPRNINFQTVSLNNLTLITDFTEDDVYEIVLMNQLTSDQLYIKYNILLPAIAKYKMQKKEI